MTAETANKATSDETGFQLQAQSLLDERRRDFQQLLRHGHQLIER